jgi:hypothetical protein
MGNVNFTKYKNTVNNLASQYSALRLQASPMRSHDVLAMEVTSYM